MIIIRFLKSNAFRNTHMSVTLVLLVTLALFVWFGDWNKKYPYEVIAAVIFLMFSFFIALIRLEPIEPAKQEPRNQKSRP